MAVEPTAIAYYGKQQDVSGSLLPSHADNLRIGCETTNVKYSALNLADNQIYIQGRLGIGYHRLMGLTMYAWMPQLRIHSV